MLLPQSFWFVDFRLCRICPALAPCLAISEECPVIESTLDLCASNMEAGVHIAAMSYVRYQRII